LCRKILNFVIFSRFYSLVVLTATLSLASSVKITCKVGNATLYISDLDSFECEIVNDLQIFEINSKIQSISGSQNDTEFDYEDNSTYLDISDVKFTTLITYNNTLHFLPLNIDEFFPKLSLLAVVKSNLREIHQSELSRLKELRALWLPFNNIETIEWRLFDHNPKLSEIILTENRIKVIHANAFGKLPLLEHLDLLANVCVDRFAATRDDTDELIGLVSEDCRYECECEKYYLVGIGILAMFGVFVIIYVFLK
jgi:hypothetical protein